MLGLAQAQSSPTAVPERPTNAGSVDKRGQERSRDILFPRAQHHRTAGIRRNRPACTTV